jgi:two-component system OmpR family response regulator
MDQKAYSIAIIDDDPLMAQLVEDLVLRTYPNASPLRYGSGEEALASGFDPDLVILDYHLDATKPDALNGMQVLSKLRDRQLRAPVLFLSGQDRLEVASNTIKFGAFDYIVKNETALPRLEKAMANALEIRTLRATTRTQSLMNRIFWIVIAGFIAYFLYLRLAG